MTVSLVTGVACKLQGYVEGDGVRDSYRGLGASACWPKPWHTLGGIRGWAGEPSRTLLSSGSSGVRALDTTATAAPAEGRATTAARGTTITGGTIIFDLGM